MRRYWVCFKIVTSQGIGDGELMIERELPITHERDLNEIANAIKKQAGDTLDPAAVVRIKSWQKFEEEGIAIPKLHLVPA